MQNDEFAFFNQQLAGMLRTGIPLEGALRQLTITLRAGQLRTEFEALGADLAQGVPLRDAAGRRNLPPLYVQLIRLGAASQDLPGILTMVADYYQRRHNLWTRLKGLLVYPALVLVIMIAVSGLLLFLYSHLKSSMNLAFEGQAWGGEAADQILIAVPMATMLFLLLGLLTSVAVPSAREWLRWRLPGFRESSLAQFAGVMRLLLEKGGKLDEALTLVGKLEQDGCLGREVEEWRKKLAEGKGKFASFASGGKVLPPLFFWMVAQEGEDLAKGFARAADLYYERARHKVELLLYAVLPVSVLVIGGLILCQLYMALRFVIIQMNWLGSIDG